jgi:glyceraldehyde 3-phosphate dehydrogenase
VALLKKPADTESLRAAFRNASENELAGIMACEDKVVTWYDNEWGYSCRVVDLAAYMAEKGL